MTQDTAVQLQVQHIDDSDGREWVAVRRYRYGRRGSRVRTTCEPAPSGGAE